MNNSVGQEVLAQVRKLGFLQRLTYSILAQERFISLSRLSCFSLFFFLFLRVNSVALRQSLCRVN